eukprot:TRINITY_DN6831_c0_g1_i2.p1 TRINITY_DN6831_c0_g1~~TRINITY_DN6831_c0_g1_i2.p1  ORF type:complete len:167 (-),score=27.14 TRINITY_DN6831_c0_g1_i2:211-666(-)
MCIRDRVSTQSTWDLFQIFNETCLLIIYSIVIIFAFYDFFEYKSLDKKRSIGQAVYYCSLCIMFSSLTSAIISIIQLIYNLIKFLYKRFKNKSLKRKILPEKVKIKQLNCEIQQKQEKFNASSNLNTMVDNSQKKTNLIINQRKFIKTDQF